MTGDALLYGELARNLAAGRGFVASYIYPISLAYPPLHALPQPHVLYHPAYPALLAAVFRVAGMQDAVIVATNALLAVALLGVTFVLARRLFDARVACLATAALALDTTVVSNVRNGGTEVLAMAVVTATALMLVSAPTRWKGAAAGALLGIAYLTRPNLLVLLPLAAVALWRMGARAAIVPLIGGAAVVIGPWVVRGWLVMGQPFFSLYTVANIAWDTPSFPGLIATYGTLVPRGLGVMIADYPAELFAKLGTNLVYYARQSVFTANPIAVAAFALGLLLVWRRSARSAAVSVDRALGEWVAASAAVTVVLASMLAREPRYLAPFAPAIVVLGIGWTFAAVTASGRPVLRLVATVLMLALPVAVTVRDRPVEGSRWRDPNLEAVAALTRDSDVIVTDIGRGVTWYAGRTTVQAPIDRATLERVATIVPVTAIYLSARAVSGWGAMYGAPLDVGAYVPAGYVAVASFPDGGRLWRRPGRPVH
jgi:4-amino-4-deoxy-L-arabinose transferase-like glycosyltransferase